VKRGRSLGHVTYFKILGPLISLAWLKIQSSNFARWLKVRDTKLKNEKFWKSACGLGHVTYFSNFGTLLTSLERPRIQTRNFACTLIVTDNKRKKMKNWPKGAWPRSRATSRYHDLLNKQVTEALRLGKIRESIASDFQHGYRMWTWFVNFLDKKKQKLISNTEHQFNTLV